MERDTADTGCLLLYFLAENAMILCSFFVVYQKAPIIPSCLLREYEPQH